MRILITGSRTWTNQNAVYGAIHKEVARANAQYDDVVIVHGACPSGADAIADRVLFGRVERHPANWQELGRRAGFVRNQHMVDLGADVCLAFIKDGSPGASHTARIAEEAGIRTVRYEA